MAFNQGGTRGHIFVPSRARGLLKRSIPRGTRRRNLTVVAVICNDVEMQSYLPQYIIANKTTFKAKEFASLKVSFFFLWSSWSVVVQAACPDHVTLVRQESAWNTESLFSKIIRRLGRLVKEHRPNTRAILMFDSASLHLSGILVNVFVRGVVMCQLLVQGRCCAHVKPSTCCPK